MKRSILIILISLVVVAGGVLSWLDGRSIIRPTNQPANSDRLIPLTLYTSPSVTTPQLAFWRAYKNGIFQSDFLLNVEYWKDPDSLQTVLLAGKGDLWIGHLEGFGLAKKRGAPITLLAVTGWKKFYLLSKDPEIKGFSSLSGKTVPFAPPGSPAIPILQGILGKEASAVAFEPHESKQLTLQTVSGNCDTLIAPEPLVTGLLEKVPGLKIIASVEEEYGKKYGMNNRIPLAGIAINSKTAVRYPTLAKRILIGLKEASDQLETEKPESIVKVLPSEYFQYVPEQQVAGSLKRDIVHVESAHDVSKEIVAYFRLVAPELVSGETLALDSSFFWQEND